MPVNSEIGAVAPSQRGVGGDSLTPMVDTKPKRLLSPAALTFLALWYLTSLSTLFLNKHILSTLQGNPQSLAVAQMTTTCVMGAAKVRWRLFHHLPQPFPVHGARCRVSV